MAVDSAKEKRKKLFVIGLIFLLVPLLLYNLNRHKRSQEQRKKVQLQRQASSATLLTGGEGRGAAVQDQTGSAADLQNYQSGLVWKRDPFVLGGSEEGKGPILQLKVSGIIYDDIHPEATYAILNEEVVRIGDDFHGIKIIDVQPDYVRLKKFDQELILYLYQEEGKP